MCRPDADLPSGDFWSGIVESQGEENTQGTAWFECLCSDGVATYDSAAVGDSDSGETAPHDDPRAHCECVLLLFVVDVCDGIHIVPVF